MQGTFRRTGKSGARRAQDLELRRRVIWSFFLAKTVEVRGTIPGFDAEAKRALRLLLVDKLGSPSHLEIIRRIERAFADPELSKAEISLGLIYTHWRRLAAA